MNHLTDPNYPTVFPVEGGSLYLMTTRDVRNDYFDYVCISWAEFESQRNRALLSNYKRKRYWSDNNRNQAGIANQMMLYAEIQYVLAECELGLGNLIKAAEWLNNSPRVTVGSLSEVSADEQEI